MASPVVSEVCGAIVKPSPADAPCGMEGGDPNGGGVRRCRAWNASGGVGSGERKVRGAPRLRGGPTTQEASATPSLLEHIARHLLPPSDRSEMRAWPWTGLPCPWQALASRRDSLHWAPFAERAMDGDGGEAQGIDSIKHHACSRLVGRHRPQQPRSAGRPHSNRKVRSKAARGGASNKARIDGKAPLSAFALPPLEAGLYVCFAVLGVGAGHTRTQRKRRERPNQTTKQPNEQKSLFVTFARSTPRFQIHRIESMIHWTLSIATQCANGRLGQS